MDRSKGREICAVQAVISGGGGKKGGYVSCLCENKCTYECMTKTERESV